MSFLQDNGGPIALIVVMLGAIAGYIELRLPSEADLDARVAAAFTNAGNVRPHRVDAIEEDVEELEEEDKKLDNKIERIVGILLED